MRFTFDDRPIDVDAEQLEPVTSPHTGNVLQRMTIGVRGRSRKDPTVKRFLRGGVLKDTQGQSWQVVQSSGYTSTSRGESDWTMYQVQIEQMENRTAERIVFGGLTFVPEKYTERANADGELTIKARVVAQGEALKRLKQVLVDDGRIDLVRHGVSEVPVTVELDLISWSENDTESEGVFDIEFDGRTRTTQPPLPGPFAELYPIRTLAAMGAAAAIVLVAKLTEKGVITADEAQQLTKDIAAESGNQIFRIRRTSDVRLVPFGNDDDADDDD